MVKNNIELDVKVKCIENGITQAKLADYSGRRVLLVETIAKTLDRVFKRKNEME